MTIEENKKRPSRRTGKPSGNFALYAILAVGVLYVIFRLVLHFTQGE